MSTCDKTPYLNGKHEWQWYPRPRKYHCAYGCGATKSGSAPSGDAPNSVGYYSNVSTKNPLHKVANNTPCMLALFMIPFVLPIAIVRAGISMVHSRYEKKCGRWSHVWKETKREVINRHANKCLQKVRVYFSCEKCSDAKKETVSAPGHRMRPVNDVVMKGDDGYLSKIRVLVCANECGHKDTKQIGKKWKP